MRQSKDNHRVPFSSLKSGLGSEVLQDVFYYTNQIVNVIFVGKKQSEKWFLVDCGLPYSAKKIIYEAKKRYLSPPSAIFLTHGHYDHIGNVVALVNEWNVPVFAHPLEFPFLTGKIDYPKPDISVEGGLLARLSFLYPHGSIHIASALMTLPTDGTLPGFPEWNWIHTPGNSPGHVSYFRICDRTLIAGDAFLTVRGDSFGKVFMQNSEVNGPPRHSTTDWLAALASINALEKLKPELTITGHGRVMSGKTLQNGLRELVENFENFARPAYGKYLSTA